MQEQSGFVIKFSTISNFSSAVNLVKELLNSHFMEDFYSDYFHIDKNEIELEDDFPMGYELCQGLFKEICKAVSATYLDSVYNGYAHYCNLSVNYDEYVIMKYSGTEKRLCVTEIGGEALLECPDCGERLINPLNFTIKDSYYCKKCKKYIEFSEVDKLRNYEYSLVDGNFIFIDND